MIDKDTVMCIILPKNEIVLDEDKTPIDPDDFLGKFEIRVRDLFKEPNDGIFSQELTNNSTSIHYTYFTTS